MMRAHQSPRAADLRKRIRRATCLLVILAATASAAYGQPVESIIGDPSAHAAARFAQNCVPLRDLYAEGPDIQRSCSVNEFGPLTGAGGGQFYFALYRRLVTIGAEVPSLPLDRPPYRNTAVVIFAADNGNRSPGIAPMMLLSFLIRHPRERANLRELAAQLGP